MRTELRMAGAALLARRGADRTMAEIARHAGVRSASIAHLYPRRHDLIHDILHAHFDGLLEHVGGTEEAEADASPFARLTCMVQAYLDFVLAYRDEQVVAISLLDTLPVAQREPLRYQLRLLAHRLTLAIAAAIPGLEGVHPLCRPVGLTLMAALNAAALWFRDDGALLREDYAVLLTRQAVEGARAASGA
jgi:AcrR family transcriptional regulator